MQCNCACVPESVLPGTYLDSTRNVCSVHACGHSDLSSLFVFNHDWACLTQTGPVPWLPTMSHQSGDSLPLSVSPNYTLQGLSFGCNVSYKCVLQKSPLDRPGWSGEYCTIRCQRAIGTSGGLVEEELMPHDASGALTTRKFPN